MRKCSYLVATAMLLYVSLVLGQVSVLTQHNDVSRTGANLKETSLNTFTVKASQFGKLFKRSVDGQIYGQPLYVPNLSIPNQGSHNVVYVATMHSSVYAFDTDDPNASTPLWQRNLGPSVPHSDVGGGTIDIEVGITGTPVIDLLSHTLYCVAKTKENSTYFQRLHALDITTGQPKSGSPVVIAASASGTGDGSINGTVSFNPLRHLNRPALLLLNGVIYLAFGSHEDRDPYHAWVLSYNATTLQQMAVFNGTANGSRGGIWQGGQGLAADANGYIYLMTGNGTFDYNVGGPDLGMSFIKLSTPGLAVADWFTPYNVNSLNTGDTDLGGSGPLLIPGTNLVLGGGKEGVFHLLNRDMMGHFNAGSNSQIVQNFKATAGHIHGSPIYWNGPNGAMIYVWSEQDRLKQFRLTNGLLQTTPVATSTMFVPTGMPGAMLSLSANGSLAGSGIVWASHPYNANANPATVAGILRAFDASNVSVELWNSKQNAARDDVGNFAKFCPATVANGKVYLATFSNQLVVYGLLGETSGGSLVGSLATPVSPTNLTSEGTTDWAHWGLNTATSFDHKAGVSQQISNFTPVGTNSTSVARFADNPTAFTWSDGTPTMSATNTTTGVYVIGLNKGFQITLPADTTSRTLRIYLGLWKAQGKLEATLSDGSAPAFTNTSLNNTSGTQNGVCTINYRAASSGQTLTLKYTATNTYDTFGNVTLQAATLAGGGSADDFNGDGKADIVWHNEASGQTVVWLMNGPLYASTGFLGTVADLNWKLAGTADFNGDGQTDLLWRNYATGQNVVWLMNGTQYTSAVSIGTVADTNWKIVAPADFNGDGKIDILWRHAGTGQNVVWFMDGTSPAGLTSLATVSDTGWKIIGAADFNRDGKPDVVWSNPTTGQNVVWFMNGTSYQGYAVLATVADPNWKIEATSDYDNDGQPNLLWRNAATGQIVLWFMDGTTYKGWLSLVTVADLNWKIGNEQ